MPVDLAMSHTGDLVFAGNRDLMIVDNDAWLNQRLMVRILTPRGSYVGDPEEVIGSDLGASLRLARDQRGLDDVRLKIEEALALMDDIVIVEVAVGFSESDHSGVEVLIRYTVVGDDEEDVDDSVNPDEIVETQFLF